MAVAIVIDNSGSMEDAAENDTVPKFRVARNAVDEMLTATDAFVASRPDLPVKVAIFQFARSAIRVMPIQDYDRRRVREALAQIPYPEGGTAIGDAMSDAQQELYRSGVFRKYLVVVTDGENTHGRSPRRQALEIHGRSEGAVRMYFVAFDTDPAKFGFLDEVEGQVLSARNADALRDGLNDLYQRRILAESMDDVEPVPRDEPPRP